MPSEHRVLPSRFSFSALRAMPSRKRLFGKQPPLPTRRLRRTTPPSLLSQQLPAPPQHEWCMVFPCVSCACAQLWPKLNFDFSLWDLPPFPPSNQCWARGSLKCLFPDPCAACPTNIDFGGKGAGEEKKIVSNISGIEQGSELAPGVTDKSIFPICQH